MDVAADEGSGRCVRPFFVRRMASTCAASAQTRPGSYLLGAENGWLEGSRPMEYLIFFGILA